MNQVRIENYKRFLKSEEIKFSNGESSLFLMNKEKTNYQKLKQQTSRTESQNDLNYFKTESLENNTLKQ